MHDITESKKNHLWRKLVWQTDPDQSPLGPFHHAEVYCCEESNGYAVWYVRRLAKDDRRGMAGVESADYLLDFFPKTRRDDAIERAVLVANNAVDVDQLIAALDALAAAGKKV
ncbi:hypothetical protein [Noviherbaspirillum sedimenti]|uniref:Uncharacterized protein n=1 Tax=Noviherbaspirillum sedimenti TaxID=2320865 RepID=A0A3A3G1G0_9BURK|nr:hypothetical protein [Noviherbaspirillum sedimenti]RJG01751.1 hypothetical protein D3878_09285 [Noviherbaspirillum sedimenti]